jgi:catechol 2,3-dioxygenase-like lactoylglutathione lyase family enzyme
MKIQRIDHVSINVNDLAAAKAFFLDFGLELQGEGELEGDWLDELTGLKDVRTSIIFLRMPEGEATIELVKFHRPIDQNGIQQSSVNTLGIRHIAFAVEDIDALLAKLKAKGTEIFSEVYNYQNSYKICYLRGPEGIILELAEKIQD